MVTRAALGLLGAVSLAAALSGCRGKHEEPGEVTEKRLPAAVVSARAERQRQAAQRLTRGAEAGSIGAKQILFGDLHVHTTFSADAFLASLPLLQGEGTHPPADACDFARFCSDLDFWSINDHAEAISPQHWRETKESIRQCNAVAGDAGDPDAVAFLGWEWTQVGTTPETHYGHKNVILRETAEDRVPTRPISALSPQLVGALRQPAPLWQRIQMPLLDWPNRQRYLDFGVFQAELRDVPICEEGVDVRKLPEDCSEVALTPDVLFEKLAQWGFDSMVIPHGNTWGLYTPPGSSWDKQLAGRQHDPEQQLLIEVFSGHGNSEEYRGWKEIDWDEKGNPICPEPTREYEPCCWRAGEIIRARCGAETPRDECERRVREARINYLNAGAAARMTMPGAQVTDWKDCGQCRDCFLPAFNMRPRSSVQYAMAISNFDNPAEPRRFRFGFMASSDNHKARPGTGYKEYGRRMMTEAAGARSARWAARLGFGPGEPVAESVPFDPATSRVPAFQTVDFERQASFFLTGGLVAVHAGGRDRDSIWEALKRRQVYGTSGDRILLWFDLLNGPNGVAPMGSEVALGEAPRFRAAAVGAFKQKPGCPAHSVEALSSERLEYLCRGECYNPSDERKLITRIEIVRIRPQAAPNEPVGRLIEDPWKRFECTPDPAGCQVEFEDPELAGGGREALYYARAVEEPSPAVNAANLRCEYDNAGNCVKLNPCYGDYRTDYNEDCLAPNEERAWSSPIFVRPS
jgi:hypothetical protein